MAHSNRGRDSVAHDGSESGDGGAGGKETEKEARPPRVWIHADESCLGNQFRDRARAGGAAGLVEHWRGGQWVRRDYWIAEPDTTNNRMAIQSALEPLRALRGSCRIHFVSDSEYLVKGMTEWLPGWKARGWRRRRGAIENLELWQALDEATTRHRIQWHWVRGHAGHPENEYAHHLAVQAATVQEGSGGLIPSSFQEWLDDERDRHERYLDYQEFLAPEERWPDLG